MKRFLTIYLMLALMAWAVPVSAIKVETEKIEKKDEAPQEAKPANDQSGEKAAEGESAATKPEPAPATKSRGNLLDKLRRSVEDSKKEKADTPKYDQFRDADNDGVSDRVPKAKSDEGAKPSPTVEKAKPVTKEKTKTKKAPTQTLKKKTPETTSTKKKKP